MLALVLLLAQPVTKDSGGWRGDFVLTIRGEGSTRNATSTARWKIDREARGTVVLDRPIEGAALSRTPDGRNTTRYESWIGSKTLPISVRIEDEVVQRGPLFSPKEIRKDTLRVTCPAGPKKATLNGELGWPTLQFDRQEGTFTWEAPRIEAPSQYYFLREFVEGPKAWTSKPALKTDELQLGFQIIHQLNQPSDWLRFSGRFKQGQTEIILTRKFAFTPMLMVGLTPGKLDAQLTLVLRKSP
ncbi:MAG: hypothetical protein K1X67_01405 [Fimbriimonadaceae bacterium]|nr:hypothetical protein [Fimbriimonadaceae bacterium]